MKVETEKGNLKISSNTSGNDSSNEQKKESILIDK